MRILAREVGKYLMLSGLTPEAYVYMLLCEGSGEWPVYIKIGMSCEPYRRLTTLMTGCPVPAIKLAICPVRSRRLARSIERRLLKATERWTANGEWRRLKLEDKSAFNACWKAIFDAESDYAWKPSWDMHSVAEIQRLGALRLRLHRLKFAKRGPAYRDFVRHSQS